MPRHNETVASQMKRLGRFTAGAFMLSGVLILYGSLCRLTSLYFFWESLTIGMLLLPVAFIAMLFEKFQRSGVSEKNHTGEKIGIGFFILLLCIQIILLSTIPFMDAYKAARIFLLSDEQLVKEIGSVREFSVLPLGSIRSGSKTSYVCIYLTVKGSTKYRDRIVTVIKDFGGPWRITENQEEISRYIQGDE